MAEGDSIARLAARLDASLRGAGTPVLTVRPTHSPTSTVVGHLGPDLLGPDADAEAGLERAAVLLTEIGDPAWSAANQRQPLVG